MRFFCFCFFDWILAFQPIVAVSLRPQNPGVGRALPGSESTYSPGGTQVKNRFSTGAVQIIADCAKYDPKNPEQLQIPK